MRTWKEKFGGLPTAQDSAIAGVLCCNGPECHCRLSYRYRLHRSSAKQKIAAQCSAVVYVRVAFGTTVTGSQNEEEGLKLISSRCN